MQLTGCLNVVRFECSRRVRGGARKTMEVRTEIKIDVDGNVEGVGRFCYLGDMLSSGGGAGEALTARVQCAWAKF